MAGSDYTYDDARIGIDGAVAITWQAICATSVINYTKTNQAIIAVFITSASCVPATETFKLRWKNLTDVGAFADLTGAGELQGAASAGAITNTNAVGDSAACEANVDDDEEVENENPLLTGNLTGVQNRFVETQWCVDFSNALDGKEYQFEIYSNTESAAVGTVVPTITTSAAAGWSGKMKGVTDPAKINGIAVANIGKVNGEA